MMKSKIKKIIRKFANIPVDQNWLKTGQEQMIKFIELNPVRKADPVRQITPEVIFNNFNKLILKPMPIAIIAMIMSLAAGSGVVAASQNSLPTGALYPVKIATEQIREAMTFNNEKKIDLSVKLAEKRLNEIKELQKNGEVPEIVINQALVKYKKHIAAAQNQLANISSSNTASKTIAVAVKYGNSLEKQQEQLATLTNQISTLSQTAQSSLNQAKKSNIANSNQALEKIELKIQETEANRAGNNQSARGGISSQIGVISSTAMGKIPDYIHDIDEKTKNRINAIENKLAEIQKKINYFAGLNTNKCNSTEQQAYLTKLEDYYQKMLTVLVEAKRLFEQKDYLTALNQANYVMNLAVDTDSIIGQWRSHCGDDQDTPIACAMPLCGGGEAYLTGELYEGGCPIYKCRQKNECKMVFSNCDCANKCLEIVEGQTFTDCARACSLEETNNYIPNCGYQNNLCQDLAGTKICPTRAALHPDWCKDGTIYPGEIDSNGCPGAPRCVMQKEIQSSELKSSSPTNQSEAGR